MLAAMLSDLSFCRYRLDSVGGWADSARRTATLNAIEHRINIVLYNIDTLKGYNYATYN